MAAAALAVVGAWGRSSRWAWFEDGLELGGRKTTFVGDDLGFDFFAGQGEGDEDGFAFCAGETRSTVDGFFDVELHG
jgi:hypothetical protein